MSTDCFPKGASSMLVLGIETSCDETAAAVVEDGLTIRSNIIATQVELHRKYGGVVPEIASRRHLETALPVVKEALAEAGVALGDIGLVAVTRGPGLVGSLLVGLAVGKALAYALDIPLVGVNHLEGHIYANFLGKGEPAWPLVCLVVSGGHTSLWYLEGHGRMELLGSTRDDAAGEAFDKVARLLGLGYPGGPLLDALAREGNPRAIDFPRAYLEEGSYDFSFSGLKTAVAVYLERRARQGEEVNRADVAASFQQAVAEVLVEKALRAAREKKARGLIMAGGVAANSTLRALLADRTAEEGVEVSFPSPALCTDNAAMIAAAGYFAWRRGETSSLFLTASPSL